MNYQKLLLALCYSFSSLLLSAQTNFTEKPRNLTTPGKIVIEVEISPELQEYWEKRKISDLDSLRMYIMSVDRVGNEDEYRAFSATPPAGKNSITMEFISDMPLFFNTKLFKVPMLSPGDSIYIQCNEGKINYTGNGSDKNALMEELRAAEKARKSPTKAFYTLQSQNEYDQWVAFNSQLSEVQLAILEKYKKRITAFEYNFQRSQVIMTNELNKIFCFIMLVDRNRKDSTLKISNKDLCLIWDSTQYNANRDWLVSLPSYYGSPYILYYISSLEVRRRFGFDAEHDSIRHKEKRTYLYYEDAKKRYQRLTRERALTYMLDEPTMEEMGLQSDMTQLMLGDYYAQPGYQEHKNWVREREKSFQLLTSKTGAVNFTLTDINGRPFTKENLKGKIAFLDFWFTGCKPCIETTPYLQQLEDTFKGDSNVVMVSISTDADRDTWLKSVEGGKYTTSNAIHLFTNGEGPSHSMLKFYRVDGYPEFHLLDPQGKLVQFPLPKPRTAEGVAAVIQLIRKEIEKKNRDEIAAANDGPYLWHGATQQQFFKIENNQLIFRETASFGNADFTVPTDQKGIFFPVRLKPTLTPEPGEYDRPSKLLAFSDIEGNFDALRKLLQNNGIIDSQFNWTFGTGHLVFAGDMFDRGMQVTECLWLLYSLEEKAKAAGGYVHFVLGNHEILNLQGKHKYTRDKYASTARLIGKPLKELYSDKTELGRWLRTKNIVEKVGDLLFAHAGFSAEFNSLRLPVSAINQLARGYYEDTTKVFNDTGLNVIMNTVTGPFWYRGYYKGSYRNLGEQIDQTLKLYAVKHIVTGHTIMADTISTYFDGKVINTDTHHALGRSEALFVEGHSFYRVNALGQKFILFSRKESE